MEIFIKFANNLDIKNKKFKLKLNHTGNEETMHECLLNQIKTSFNLNPNEFSLLSENGVVKLNKNAIIQSQQTFQISPTVLGGKVS
jgi:hypothetical protein